MATCNEHGVYTADETLELPRAVKGWRGMGLAEIKLANLGTHWIWATGYQMFSGNWEGAFSPLADHEAHQAPSRDAAIGAASEYLRKRLSLRDDADARTVRAWLDGLVQVIPAQFDLFGAAA